MFLQDVTTKLIRFVRYAKYVIISYNNKFSSVYNLVLSLKPLGCFVTIPNWLKVKKI